MLVESTCYHDRSLCWQVESKWQRKIKFPPILKFPSYLIDTKDAFTFVTDKGLKYN